jgi:hypothetical protein
MQSDAVLRFQSLVAAVRDVGFPVVVATCFVWSSLVSIPSGFDRLIASEREIQKENAVILARLVHDNEKLGEQLGRLLEKVSR